MSVGLLKGIVLKASRISTLKIAVLAEKKRRINLGSNSGSTTLSYVSFDRFLKLI